MKVLVVGASQGTGALCVKSTRAQRHEVSAFSRPPGKLAITHPALTKIVGDCEPQLGRAKPSHSADNPAIKKKFFARLFPKKGARSILPSGDRHAASHQSLRSAGRGTRK